MSAEAEVQKRWRQFCPLYDHIDLTVESVTDGIFRCRVPLTAGNLNHLGTVHAAVQWACAEVLGGIVGMTLIDPEQWSNHYGAVKSVSIEFLRAARTGITAETIFTDQQVEQVRTEVLSGRDTEFQLNAVIRDEHGETVAITDAHYVIRPLRR